MTTVYANTFSNLETVKVEILRGKVECALTRFQEEKGSQQQSIELSKPVLEKLLDILKEQ